jgi:hypothetical protein
MCEKYRQSSATGKCMRYKEKREQGVFVRLCNAYDTLVGEIPDCKMRHR